LFTDVTVKYGKLHRIKVKRALSKNAVVSSDIVDVIGYKPRKASTWNVAQD
jgi:hypothetical protein